MNDQLCQLYLDIENFHQQDCSLETSIGITSSSGTSSGEGDEAPLNVKVNILYKILFLINAQCMPNHMRTVTVATLPGYCHSVS